MKKTMSGQFRSGQFMSGQFRSGRFGSVNFHLSGCPLYLLSRLQKVQKSAAKLVFTARKRDHVQPLLQALHWLPVQVRTDYKLSTIGHNVFSDSSSAQFSDLLTVHTPSRQLRSSADTRTLRIPHVKTETFGQRCFSY